MAGLELKRVECLTTHERKEAALVRERLLWLSDVNQNYARRRRSARPARPTSISRPEVGSGTPTAVQAPAACEGVDCEPHLRDWDEVPVKVCRSFASVK